MSEMVERAGLSVAGEFASFIEDQALPGLPIQADAFWRGLTDIYARFTGACFRLRRPRQDVGQGLRAKSHHAASAAGERK